MKKIFSFDAETNGLWGKAFWIGAIVYGENGTEVVRYEGRLPDSFVTDVWVKENVLPKMGGIPVTHSNYKELLEDFASFYLAHKEGADIVVHMGVPVEAGLLIDMHTHGLIGDFQGPYPLLDVSGNLQQVGEDPTSCDKYVAKHGLEIGVGGDIVGGTHNPLYDSAVAAAVYRHLLATRK